MVGEMETESSGQAAEMPALDFSEGGDYEDTAAEVLETVTDAQDLPRPALNTAAAADTGVEEISVQEPSTQHQQRSECGSQVRTIDEESNEEKRAEDAPELAVPEPEVSSSTKNRAAARKAMIDMINLGKKSTR